MINKQTAPPQFCCHSTIAIAAPMFEHDLLNGGPHFHLFFDGQTFLQRAIEAGPTYLGQLTHPFNTQAALQRHHFPDLVVDAFAPEPSFCWRRASTFCKAPLKKSSSRVLSASTRLSWLTSLRRVDSREFCGGGHSLLSGGSSWSRQRYNSRRSISNSLDSAKISSHCFMRSTHARRNSFE